MNRPPIKKGFVYHWTDLIIVLNSPLISIIFIPIVNSNSSFGYEYVNLLNVFWSSFISSLFVSSLCCFFIIFKLNPYTGQWGAWRQGRLRVINRSHVNPFTGIKYRCMSFYRPFAFHSRSYAMWAVKPERVAVIPRSLKSPSYSPTCLMCGYVSPLKVTWVAYVAYPIKKA